MSNYRIYYTLGGNSYSIDIQAANIQTAFQLLSRRIERQYRGMFFYQVSDWEVLR